MQFRQKLSHKLAIAQRRLVFDALRVRRPRSASLREIAKVLELEKCDHAVPRFARSAEGWRCAIMNRHRFQRESTGKEESDGLSKIEKLKRLEYQDLGKESHFYKTKQLSGKSGEPQLCF